jgi:hypothetical protein
MLGLWAAAIATAPNLVWKLGLAAVAVLLPLGLWALEKPGRWVGAFFAAALLLPPLPIALGDSGPHVAVLFAGLGVLSGLVRLPTWRVPINSLTGAIAALSTILLASVTYAAIHSGAAAAAGSLVRVGLFGISVYVFFFTAHGPGRHAGSFSSIRLLYWAAALAALFACVDFYFQFPAPAGYGPQFVWLDSGVYRRAQGLFYEASTLGNFCAFFLVMIAVCLTRRRSESPVSGIASIVGGALFLGALVLSYSRSSVVSLAVGGAVLVWQNRKRIPVTKLLAATAVFGGLGGLAVWKIFPEFVENYWLRITNSAAYLFSATDGVLSGRVASWATLTGWIADHPWQALIGIGYKTLPYTYSVGAPVIGDNMYLSLLVETGVVGVAALVWLNVAILRAAARASRRTNAQAAFCGTWILCFWAGQTVQMVSADVLTFWRVLPLYFWVLALAVRE